MSASLPAFTDANFETEVKASQTPVLVDFGATWCGPCRALAPIVEEMAREYTGRLKVGTVDIDQAQKTAATFGIMSVPTVLFFKGGKQVDKLVGLPRNAKADLRQRIENVLK